MNDDNLSKIPVDLLNLFVAPADTMRPQFRTPYECKDGWVYASNLHIAIRIKKELIGVDFPSTYAEGRNYPKLPIPTDPFEATISLKALKRAMKKLPEVDEVKICDECNGSGRVEWEYEAEDGEMYYDTFDCPVCHGMGDFGKTGRKVKDTHAYFLIEDMAYPYVEILPLIKVMEMLGIENIKAVARSCGNLRLVVGDYLEIIMAGGIGGNHKIIKVS